MVLHVAKVANNCGSFLVFVFGLLLLLPDHRVSSRWIMDQETILGSFADAFGLSQIDSCLSCIRASCQVSFFVHGLPVSLEIREVKKMRAANNFWQSSEEKGKKVLTVLKLLTSALCLAVYKVYEKRDPGLQQAVWFLLWVERLSLPPCCPHSHVWNMVLLQVWWQPRLRDSRCS